MDDENAELVARFEVRASWSLCGMTCHVRPLTYAFAMVRCMQAQFDKYDRRHAFVFLESTPEVSNYTPPRRMARGSRQALRRAQAQAKAEARARAQAQAKAVVETWAQAQAKLEAEARAQAERLACSHVRVGLEPTPPGDNGTPRADRTRVTVQALSQSLCAVNKRACGGAESTQERASYAPPAGGRPRVTVQALSQAQPATHGLFHAGALLAPSAAGSNHELATLAPAAPAAAAAAGATGMEATGEQRATPPPQLSAQCFAPDLFLFSTDLERPRQGFKRPRGRITRVLKLSGDTFRREGARFAFPAEYGELQQSAGVARPNCFSARTYQVLQAHQGA